MQVGIIGALLTVGIASTALPVDARPLDEARTDVEFDRCVDEAGDRDGELRQCGEQLVAREELRLNQIWSRLFRRMSGKAKQDHLDEQRVWIAFKDKSCSLYANTGYSLEFAACRARIIVQRWSYLQELLDHSGEFLSGDVGPGD